MYPLVRVALMWRLTECVALLQEGEAAIRASGVAAAGLGRATSVLEALTGAQMTLCTTATYTGPSNQAATISAPALPKCNRPKGSKIKPKAGQPAAKQSRSIERQRRKTAAPLRGAALTKSSPKKLLPLRSPNPFEG
ncbi:unnamed protein product [Phytophthora fragariaefolia]|uniref:Unnamed protein product n=1 Tax=Phytophthora fragariaefolia TaxID=1490495 RepID=A0A9W7D049_9STRA|nr:unnamed protein product [Phytophthora fragariaefolia]